MNDVTMQNTTETSDWKPPSENGTVANEQTENVENSNTDINRHYETDWIYDDYNYFSAEIHEEFLSSIHQHTATFAVFLSVWSFIINTLVILACLRNKEPRVWGYCCQIKNFSVSNILISVFVLPLTIYHIQNEWNLGQTLCEVYVISDVLLPFTSMIILIIINIERIMSMSHPNLHSWIFQNTFKSVTVCLTWIIALVIVVPLWTSGTIPHENRPSEQDTNTPREHYENLSRETFQGEPGISKDSKPVKPFENNPWDLYENKPEDSNDNIPGKCIVLISEEAAILCPLITYFIPLIIIITLTFKLLLLKIKVSTTNSGTVETTRISLKTYQSQQNDNDGENEYSPKSRPLARSSSIHFKEKKDDIVALCIVNTLFAAMWFPFHCISFLLSFCQSSSCVPSYGLNQVLTWIGASTTGVVPIFWFIDRQMRSNLRFKFSQRLDTEFADSIHSEETFL